MLFSIPVVSAFMFISEWFSPSGLNQTTRFGVGGITQSMSLSRVQCHESLRLS